MKDVIESVYRIAHDNNTRLLRIKLKDNYTLQDFHKKKIIYKKVKKKKKPFVQVCFFLEKIAANVQKTIETAIKLCEIDHSISYLIKREELSALRLFYYMSKEYGNGGYNSEDIKRMFTKLWNDDKKHYLFYDSFFIIHRNNILNLYKSTLDKTIDNFFKQHDVCQLCPSETVVESCSYCQLRVCRFCAHYMNKNTNSLLSDDGDTDENKKCFICKTPKSIALEQYLFDKFMLDPLIVAFTRTTII